MLVRDIDIGILSILHAPVLYQSGLTYHHTFFSLWYPHHSSFPGTNILANSDEIYIPTCINAPYGGIEYRWVYKFRDFPVCGKRYKIGPYLLTMEW